MELKIKAFTVGPATLKTASSQVAIHKKVFSDDQHDSILFTFDTLGFLALEVVGLLKRV